LEGFGRFFRRLRFSTQMVDEWSAATGGIRPSAAAVPKTSPAFTMTEKFAP